VTAQEEAVDALARELFDAPIVTSPGDRIALAQWILERYVPRSEHQTVRAAMEVQAEALRDNMAWRQEMEAKVEEHEQKLSMLGTQLADLGSQLRGVQHMQHAELGALTVASDTAQRANKLDFEVQRLNERLDRAFVEIGKVAFKAGTGDATLLMEQQRREQPRDGLFGELPTVERKAGVQERLAGLEQDRTRMDQGVQEIRAALAKAAAILRGGNFNLGEVHLDLGDMLRNVFGEPEDYNTEEGQG